MNQAGDVLGSHSEEHTQICPRDGIVEHDPEEIWAAVTTCIEQAMTAAGVTAQAVAGVGITNQRETCVWWDASTGKPLCNAIVWQDTRTADECESMPEAQKQSILAKTGLPTVPYFSATKLRWMRENVSQVRAACDAGNARCGTIDSWLVYKLSGGACHVTDPSNAARTLLFNVDTVTWDDELLRMFDLQQSWMPDVVPSRGHMGEVAEPACLAGASIAAILGDQSAALYGQGCLDAGALKITYGTGAFLLQSTGHTRATEPAGGLLSTVAWQFDGQPPVYALEGSVATAGALMQWLKNSVKLVPSISAIEPMVKADLDANPTSSVTFVPALSGLLAPHWRSDARGVICGLDFSSDSNSIVRAAIEACAWQATDVLRAMADASGRKPGVVRVDGGMSVNGTLLQMQADFSGVPVARPTFTETTVLGAAVAAGIACGFWRDENAVAALRTVDAQYAPQASADVVATKRQQWQAGLSRACSWHSPQGGGPDVLGPATPSAAAAAARLPAAAGGVAPKFRPGQVLPLLGAFGLGVLAARVWQARK